ncbi:hypothetical protein CAK77_02470 [Mycobacteroides abscessus subsp. massiliense]|nr:hypothetical protein CAK77_02470 [Mycobacteroides abscessus subsp. massiliense]
MLTDGDPAGGSFLPDRSPQIQQVIVGASLAGLLFERLFDITYALDVSAANLASDDDRRLSSVSRDSTHPTHSATCAWDTCNRLIAAPIYMCPTTGTGKNLRSDCAGTDKQPNVSVTSGDSQNSED